MIAVDSNRFVTVYYKLDTGKSDRYTRIAFLSDLHSKSYGRDNAKLLDAIKEVSPDLILIGGDMVTASRNQKIEGALSLTERLKEDYPVYYGSGNHEQRLMLYPERYPGVTEKLESQLSDQGIIRLRNTEAEVQDTQITMSSVEIERAYYKRSKPPMLTAEKMREYLPGERQEGRIQILLAHNPDYFKAYRDWGADLVLAGHVHGGIVRLPFLGGVISPNLTLFPKYDGGEFKEEGSVMIISRGLGSHTIPWRLFNPGELVVIDVR
ncbi:MAG: metallophosphoesterase [Lachnospiraceae bacterium]|nr:metallophosphoesterase [Lachnospiraceae bacterium]